MTQLDRTALVTGGAGCLGRAICLSLRASGCHVIAVDRDEAALATLGADIQASAIACDLRDPNATQQAVSRAWEQHGPISILINAAGLIHNAPLISVTNATARRHSLEDWNAVIEANLTSVFLATLNVVDHMVSTRTRGVIVSLSSIASLGNAGQGAYAAAKAGVNALTSSWAKELGPLGIRFVAIAPGFIDTSSTHDALTEPLLKDWVRRTPLRRLGSVESVTSAVLFAVTNQDVTGTVIEVDGGLTL
jgi:3-oxoacyl-[acyl-carrier protein] reductase